MGKERIRRDKMKEELKDLIADMHKGDEYYNAKLTGAVKELDIVLSIAKEVNK